MQTLLQDRVDVLMEKARKGDASAQMLLAEWFSKGHLVEFSRENALYWGFKAVNSGESEMPSRYYAVKQRLLNPKWDMVGRLASCHSVLHVVAVIELVLGFLLSMVFSEDGDGVLKYTVGAIVAGFITCCLTWFVGKLTFKESHKHIQSIIQIALFFVVNLVALLVVLSN